jgi:hypothetical protein
VAAKLTILGFHMKYEDACCCYVKADDDVLVNVL